MANAGGRFVGTLLSGVMYQKGGLTACLWTSVAFAAAAALISMALPVSAYPPVITGAVPDTSE